MQQLALNLTERLDVRAQQEVASRAEALELDEGCSAHHARWVALLEALKEHPEVLTGVSAVVVEKGGEMQWLLCTDVTDARAAIQAQGGREIGSRGCLRKLSRALLRDARFLAPI